MEAATQICQGVLPSLHGPDPLSEEILPIHGATYIPYGYILLEHNNFAHADYSLTRGIELIQLCGELEILVRGSAYLARLKQAQGDPDGALRLLETARRVWPDADAYIDALVANLWLQQGDRAMDRFHAALRWAQDRRNVLEETDEIPAAMPRGERIFGTLMTVAKGLIAYRRIQDSVDLNPVYRFLEQQLHFAEIRGWQERVLALSILKALALQADDAHAKAMSSLG
jgi:tetratricopeptide (TPR) repeat protein